MKKNNAFTKFYTSLKKTLGNSRSFKNEPPVSMIKITSKMSFYSFILIGLSIIFLIIKVVTIILKTSDYIPFGIIFFLVFVGFAFYCFKRLYIKNYNENLYEFFTGTVIKKKVNKLTRQHYAIIKTESGTERELKLNKRQKVKKGAIYEFCTSSPNPDSDEIFIISISFIDYADKDEKDAKEEIKEELIEEE